VAFRTINKISFPVLAGNLKSNIPSQPNISADQLADGEVRPPNYGSILCTLTKTYTKITRDMLINPVKNRLGFQ